MGIICPEIERALSEARNRARAAMSFGSTNLFMDWLASACLVTSATDLRVTLAIRSMTCCMRGPSTAPGKIALTRMFASPSSIESVLVRPMRPHLVVAYHAYDQTKLMIAEGWVQDAEEYCKGPDAEEYSKGWRGLIIASSKLCMWLCTYLFGSRRFCYKMRHYWLRTVFE
jgi:hypothetical protein